MQNGSLVVILPLNRFLEEHPYRDCITWTPVDDEKEVYMVREVLHSDNVTFEEGTLGKTPLGFEIGIPVKYVREILPVDNVDIKKLMREPLCT